MMHKRHLLAMPYYKHSPVIERISKSRMIKYTINTDQKNVEDKKKLYEAALVNNIELMQKYLDNGMSPNTQDHRGRSPLHIASGR